MAASVASKLQEVRQRVDAAAREAGRTPSTVTLIAVSKGQPDGRLAEAVSAGYRVFGENRVQEAQKHWLDRRREIGDLELHLIGPLQTNKVHEAVALFDVIQTVDRPKLVDALLRAFEGLGVARQCFVQVNTGAEAHKAGVLPENADGFVEFCRNSGLPIIGLMCIPPVDEAPAPHFALLSEMARRNGLGALSMGMSRDFETAIALGATHIRVGTEIFGERVLLGEVRD